MKLSDEERERLKTLIHMGKHPARQLMKARILLKADASEGGGEGWSDSRIARGSEYQRSPRSVGTRQQLVEEGFDAVLTRKHSPLVGQTPYFRRRQRGQTDRPSLLRTTQGARAMDVAACWKMQGCGTEHRRAGPAITRSGGR